jgi:hypothetical protein
MVVVSAGPLVVAPDLEAGMPSDPATRSGRALALQLLAVLQARADGLPARQIGIGVSPAWLADEPRPAARAAAEVAIRRALFAGHPLVYEEPRSDPQPSHEWPFVMAGTLPTADAAGIVIRRPEPGGGARFARTTRAAVAVGLELAAARSGAVVDGVAAGHVRDAIAAATATLDGLATRGWRAVLGEPVTGPDARPLGSDAVAERTDPFDAFERA